MKFSLDYNMKILLIGVGGMSLCWWGDKNLVGWGESTRGIFFGGGMNKLWASRRELPLHPPSRENSVCS